MLNKALYRLKQSPRLWQETLRKVLAKLNFFLLEANNTVYLNKETKIFVSTYIDDFNIFGKKGPQLDQFKADLALQFKLKDLGLAQFYCSIRIVRDRKNRKIFLI